MNRKREAGCLALAERGLFALFNIIIITSNRIFTKVYDILRYVDWWKFSKLNCKIYQQNTHLHSKLNQIKLFMNWFKRIAPSDTDPSDTEYDWHNRAGSQPASSAKFPCAAHATKIAVRLDYCQLSENEALKQ